jgi:hypothetical protein
MDLGAGPSSQRIVCSTEASKTYGKNGDGGPGRGMFLVRGGGAVAT